MGRVPAALLTVAALIVLAGCTMPLFGSSPDARCDRTPPTDPTAETASEYAIGCELDRLSATPTATNVSVLRETEHGYYVRTHVRTPSTDGPNASEVTAAVYLVGNGTAARIEPRYVDNDYYFRPNDPRDQVNQALFMLDFGPDAVHFQLSMTYYSGDLPDTVFDRPYALDPGRGLFVDTVTAAAGEYSMLVAVEDGHEVTAEFNLSADHSAPLFIVVEPDGEFLVFRTPVKLPRQPDQ